MMSVRQLLPHVIPWWRCRWLSEEGHRHDTLQPDEYQGIISSGDKEQGTYLESASRGQFGNDSERERVNVIGQRYQKWEDLCITSSSDSLDALDPTEEKAELVEPAASDLNPLQGTWIQENPSRFYTISGRRLIDSRRKIVGALYKRATSGRMFIVGSILFRKGFEVDREGSSLTLHCERLNSTLKWDRGLFNLPPDQQTQIRSQLQRMNVSSSSQMEVAQGIRELLKNRSSTNTSQQGWYTEALYFGYCCVLPWNA